jgi:NagD protein
MDNPDIEKIRAKEGFICDMDGVIYHGDRLLPGVREFVEWLQAGNKKYLFLTNSSDRSPKELQEKLKRLGVEVGVDHFFTSALATASFLSSQKANGSAYIIGEPGLINAMYEVGYTMNDADPDYVVVGETSSYSYEKIEKAINLVLKGARLIGTNPDITGPIEKGIAPATGALIAPIEIATRKKAYFVGKPNPLMMRNAIKQLNTESDLAIIIGDRMDTDIIAGIESEISTCLVLSGITSRPDIADFPYRPDFVLNGVIDIVS